MKLYVTKFSPYARMARIVLLEKKLQDRVAVELAKTRTPDSPYYAVNASGRVPYLERDGAPGLEESALICDYFDRLDGAPVFVLPEGEAGWEARRLEGYARSLMDGIAVWGRELMRPENERSPTILRHEAARALRLADFWEASIGHTWMNAPLNMAQITLGCALGFESYVPDWEWRSAHPKLAGWFARTAALPSFAATAAPPRT